VNREMHRSMEKSTRQRWFFAGCVTAAVASVSSISLACLPRGGCLGDVTVFALMSGMIVLMGLGALVALFNARQP
jgi:hypothetical protein